MSTADPVRVFQNFATLDLISKGRAEIVVGRGSFIAEHVVEKIFPHSEALGEIDRFTFYMDNPLLRHRQLLNAIELIGTKVIPTIVAAG